MLTQAPGAVKQFFRVRRLGAGRRFFLSLPYGLLTDWPQTPAPTGFTELAPPRGGQSRGRCYTRPMRRASSLSSSHALPAPLPAERRDWATIKTLLPYLWAWKGRVIFALACLLLAK